MTKLEDYVLADCKRLRIPSVDVGSISHVLDELLLKAYKEGKSVKLAIDTIAQNKDLLNPLVSQIEGDLNYQRTFALRAAEQRYKTTQQLYEDEKRKKIEQETASIKSQAAVSEEKAAALAPDLEKQRADYSATLKSLTELRERVKADLAAIGGDEAYKQLLTLDKQLATDVQSLQTSPIAEPYPNPYPMTNQPVLGSTSLPAPPGSVVPSSGLSNPSSETSLEQLIDESTGTIPLTPSVPKSYTPSVPVESIAPDKAAVTQPGNASTLYERIAEMNKQEKKGFWSRVKKLFWWYS